MAKKYINRRTSISLSKEQLEEIRVAKKAYIEHTNLPYISDLNFILSSCGWMRKAIKLKEK